LLILHWPRVALTKTNKHSHHRSSRSSRSRRPRTSAAPTSSSSSPRTSSSPFPTAFPRPSARRSSLLTALPPSSKRVAPCIAAYCWLGLAVETIRTEGFTLTVGKNNPLLTRKEPKRPNSKRTFFSQVYFSRQLQQQIMTSILTLQCFLFSSSPSPFSPFLFTPSIHVICCTLRTNPSDAARRSCPGYLLFNARSLERSVGISNVQLREMRVPYVAFCLFWSGRGTKRFGLDFRGSTSKRTP
jgi:hypothetical protein